jgi:hypothetical protein
MLFLVNPDPIPFKVQVIGDRFRDYLIRVHS